MKLKKLILALALTSALAASSSIAGQFKALLLTKTNGWHHDSIAAGVTAFQKLAKLHDVDLFWTEDAQRVINDDALASYDVVIFLLTTGDILNDEQQAAFERYIQNGGGFVGIHSAADTEYEWTWYTNMIGHMFRIHPPIQTATLQVEDYDFPGMDRFAKRFIFTEEWSEFDAARHGNLHYLLSVDEKTYKPEVNWGASLQGDGMGEFHPISWYQEYDGGRAFYTALGHLPGTYDDAYFLHHVFGGMYWAATGNALNPE